MACEIDVLIVGHMTADIVPEGRMLGGTVSYAAPTYAAFGHRVGILTSAAYDEVLLGKLLPFGKVLSLPASSTLTYENVYSPEARQQYVRATAQPIQFGDIPNAWLNVPYVHLGPLAAEINPLDMARGFHKATVMLTLQGMMRQWGPDGAVRFRPWFDPQALDSIDILVYSEEDVAQHPQLTNQARELCKHLIVTNGRHGGTYYRGHQATPYDSLPVTPLDLTGAGDVFAASLLGALPLLDDDIDKAVTIAGRLAAYSVTRSGIDSAPRKQEIRAELSRMQGE